MDLVARHRALPIALAVMLGTAVAGGAAVMAIRSVLRQDLIDSAEAQTVIRVAKLRGAADRLAGRARGFLLTGDPESFRRSTQDRRAFFSRLDQLLDTSDGATRQRVQEVQAAARQYDQALEGVLAMRQRGEPTESVSRSFEQDVRPRKVPLDDALERLIEGEESRLQGLDRATERTASILALVASGVALAALVVSALLAIKLARAFQSLAVKRRELEQAMTQLERANSDLDAFAGRVAHDLRTPLTPIALMAAHLKRSHDQGVVAAAQRIERSVQRAGRMVDDFLAFSRLGRRIEDAARTPAAAAIRITLDDFAERIAADGISVELDLQEDAVVACGETLFRQVVSNLVGNALKFLHQRDRRLLQVRLHARDGRCRLEVEDTGPGVAPEAISQIFDPFYRAPGSTGPGTGIGLATVRRIVEAHGGSVTVESKAGEGALFRVVLPAAPSPPSPALPTPLPVSVTERSLPT
jgi:signal transduction histidine kinase